MYNFHIIGGESNALFFPKGISEELKCFAGRIRGECRLPNRDLSWDEVDMIAGFASREIKLAARAAAASYADIRKGLIDLNPMELDFWEMCSTPEGLLRAEGSGLILREWLEGLGSARGGWDDAQADWDSIEKVLPEKDASCIYCVLCAYALLRIDNALSAQIAGDVTAAFGSIADAGAVFSTASQFFGYDNGSAWKERCEREGRVKGALTVHAETYRLRDEVIAYWKANIDTSLSGEAAATLLKKHFPLSHRKLAEYVRAEKKLLLASRA